MRRRGASADRMPGEGQAGPDRVAERLVGPVKPDNAGGGKGPQFKDSVARRRGGRVA